MKHLIAATLILVNFQLNAQSNCSTFFVGSESMELFGYRMAMSKGYHPYIATPIMTPSNILTVNIELDGSWYRYQISSNIDLVQGLPISGSGNPFDLALDRLAMGQWSNTDGKVYVYEYNPILVNFEPLDTIISDLNQFGYAVELNDNGSKVAVSSNEGVVIFSYIYSPTSGTFSYQPIDTIGSGISYFGLKAKFHGNYLAVRNPLGLNAEGEQSGQIMMYRTNSNNQLIPLDTLSETGLSSGAEYGFDFTMYGDHLYVSAPYETVEGYYAAGKVFVYKYDALQWKWNLEQTLTETSANLNDDLRFGFSLAANENQLIVGEPGFNNSKGFAHYYWYNGYQFTEAAYCPINQSLGQDGELFGYSMAWNGRHFAIGAPQFEAFSLTAIGRIFAYPTHIIVDSNIDHEVCEGGFVDVEGIPLYSGTAYLSYPAADGNSDSLVPHNVFDTLSYEVTPTVSDNEVCRGERVVFNHTCIGCNANTVFAWDNINIVEGQEFEPIQSDVFLLVAQNIGNGCRDTAEIEIIVHDFHVTPIVSDAEICNGDAVYFSHSYYDYEPSTVFSWSHGIVEGQAFEPTQTDMFTIVINNPTIGCSDTAEIEIIVHDLLGTPQITFSNDTLFSTYPIRNQWYFEGSPLAGDTLRYLIPTYEGNYQVEYQENTCTSISEGYNYTNTGVNNSNNTSNLKVYPIPFKQHFVVESSDMESVKLFSSDGRLILHISEVQNGKATIETEQLSKGQYVLSVIGKSGVETVKIIK